MTMQNWVILKNKWEPLVIKGYMKLKYQNKYSYNHK